MSTRSRATWTRAGASRAAGQSSGRATSSDAMFLDLFYGLRAEGVPVTLHEWHTLLSALEAGLRGSSLLRFYHLGRACLVKSETWFDAYDRVFARVFRGVEGALGDAAVEKVLAWLRDPKAFPELT